VSQFGIKKFAGVVTGEGFVLFRGQNYSKSEKNAHHQSMNKRTQFKEVLNTKNTPLRGSQKSRWS
jgi:hypothetical protein